MDPSLEEAARSLGAGPIRAFYETVLKLMVPALMTSTLVTLIWGFGAFVAPTILGSPDYYTIAIEVYTETLENVKWPLGRRWQPCTWPSSRSWSVPAMSIQRRAERRWGLQRELDAGLGRLGARAMRTRGAPVWPDGRRLPARAAGAGVPRVVLSGAQHRPADGRDRCHDPVVRGVLQATSDGCSASETAFTSA